MEKEIIIEIDKNAGFCFGVVRVIKIAEEILKKENKLYCLGEIVHNEKEINRLKNMGLITIDYDQFKELKNCKVLIRAHGEPPETFQIAEKNNLELINGTCPVVFALQKKIQRLYNQIKSNYGQIIIFGKKDHPEIKGINGYIEENAIVVENINDLNKVDFNKPVYLFSQTTKDIHKYEELKNEIINRMKISRNEHNFYFYNTICNEVKKRENELSEFCKDKDIVVFISGKNSSNGKMLFEMCKRVNKNSYFVSELEQLNEIDFNNIKKIGISGATSTPVWLMEEAKNVIKKILNL